MQRGKLEFYHKNFENAINLLHGLFYPEKRLNRESEIVEALELLALSYFYTGQENQAKTYFTKLLYVRPDHQLDPFIVPPPAVLFFNQIQARPEIQNRRLQKSEEEAVRRLPKKEKQPEPAKTLVNDIYYERTIEHHSRIWMFLPFGLGQFKNGHTTKGAILASTQASALATNIFCYLLLTSMKNENGNFASTDVSLVKGLRTTGYISLGIFISLWIYGMVDANMYFQPMTETPFIKTKQESRMTSAPTTRLQPVIMPKGVGFVFSTRFD